MGKIRGTGGKTEWSYVTYINYLTFFTHCGAAVMIQGSFKENLVENDLIRTHLPSVIQQNCLTCYLIIVLPATEM